MKAWNSNQYLPAVSSCMSLQPSWLSLSGLSDTHRGGITNEPFPGNHYHGMFMVVRYRPSGGSLHRHRLPALQGLWNPGTATPVRGVNPLEALLFKKQVFDGLFPAVVGTLLLVILSVGIAIPIGMTSGVYMAEYANGSVKKIFSLLFDILASIPSIVIGLFGFALAVFFTGIFPKRSIRRFSSPVWRWPFLYCRISFGQLRLLWRPCRGKHG